MNNTHRGLPLTRAHIEQIFPKLTPTHIRRIAPHGHMRTRDVAKYSMSRDTAPHHSLLLSPPSLRLYTPRVPLRPLLPSIALVSSEVRLARCLAGGRCSECVLLSQVR